MITLNILSCLDDKDELQKVTDLIVDSGFNSYMGTPIAAEDITKGLTAPEKGVQEKNKLTISLPYAPVAEGEDDTVGDSVAELKGVLEDMGVPWTQYNQVCQDIEVFDGVRVNKVSTDDDGNPYVDMRVLRSVIDMLEEGLDARAIVYANGFWVETDVLNLWRNGMENAVTYIVEGKNAVGRSSEGEGEEIIDAKVIEGETNEIPAN